MATGRYLHPPDHIVSAAVEIALAEDLAPFGDLSSSLLDADPSATGRIVSREAGVLAGTACVSKTFGVVDQNLELHWISAEGEPVSTGETLATVAGPLESMLIAERTALNFLGHLSGIASLVAQFQRACVGHARVWDTRKTTPGLRSLEKAAVRAGGGVNHRGNLSDWVMIKDNHLIGMSIAEGVELARRRWPGRTVHVECDRQVQVQEALEARADALLFDNMSPDELCAAVAAVESHADLTSHRPLVEASGGVTLETIGAVSAAGVDYVSVGAITNSAPVLDIGLDIDEPDGDDRSGI